MRRSTALAPVAPICGPLPTPAGAQDVPQPRGGKRPVGARGAR
jgi:hypothetical protein